MAEDTEELARLALRVEGDWWNAYYAQPDSMDDALLLGSIRMAIVHGSKARKDEFTDLMVESMNDLVEQATGERPETAKYRPAPEHERSGNG